MIKYQNLSIMWFFNFEIRNEKHIHWNVLSHLLNLIVYINNDEYYVAFYFKN